MSSQSGPRPQGGHLKVFIGMAAGVGKTYRMLQEGRAEAQAGRDVAIGYLEPHGRAETEAQAKGLEAIPHRIVAYRGTPLQELDLPAVLARAPELCLIDELAHTNAPGTEHEKRYEDVRDVLAAGIDVFSTVNVQHLESLNDQVAQLESLRRLSAMLGAHLIVQEGEDVAAVAIETAASLGTTYLLMGTPGGRRGMQRLGESLLERLIRGLPGVDIRIVADPGKRFPGSGSSAGA